MLESIVLAATGEILYNGIRLSSPWPPTNAFIASQPMPVPYLTHPPAVIPIDRGRQLFVDNFLIESTTLHRRFHRVEFYPHNPVVKPDQPWEQQGRGPMATVFSDGVWYDPQERLFKMWYMGGYTRATCYATSLDGIRWEKPALDVKPPTNIVQPDGRDSSTVWLDWEENDPKRRYKMFRSHGGPEGQWGLSIHVSADGIHWSSPQLRTGPIGDRTTVFWNPFRQVWVYSIRADWSGTRSRRYWENRDLFAGAQWNRTAEPVMWVGADRLDPPREDLKVTPQLYNLDAVAYESLVLGWFTIWRGDSNIPPRRPKANSICLGFSRDGFHWDRPDRRPFIPLSEHAGDWNWGNVQSAGGGCLVVGDRLYFYFSGRAGVDSAARQRDTGGSTGLAFLRRDGFASMDAEQAEESLTTRPVTYRGKYLFVNVAAASGELRVEILDPLGHVIAPFSSANCAPVRADKTLQAVHWNQSNDLALLAGKPVKFRFHLRQGRLYAFWVSPDPSGASYGYVAGGGPGFTGSIDTVGSGADAKSSQSPGSRPGRSSLALGSGSPG